MLIWLLNLLMLMIDVDERYVSNVVAPSQSNVTPDIDFAVVQLLDFVVKWCC